MKSMKDHKRTSKNSQRHPELVSGSLVSASPQIQEIDCVELRFAPVAGHSRNDGNVTKGVFRSPLVLFHFTSYQPVNNFTDIIVHIRRLNLYFLHMFKIHNCGKLKIVADGCYRRSLSVNGQ